MQRKEFPAHFSVRMNLFESFRWDVSNFQPDWHDGGGIRGRLGIKTFLGLSMVPATVTLDAAAGLRACIAKFYGIGR